MNHKIKIFVCIDTGVYKLDIWWIRIPLPKGGGLWTLYTPVLIIGDNVFDQFNVTNVCQSLRQHCLYIYISVWHGAISFPYPVLRVVLYKVAEKISCDEENLVSEKYHNNYVAS